MLSNKPYLLRAFYDWIVDSKCTPLIVVDATQPRCIVPQDYVENGEIILNVAPDAVRDFLISDSLIEFRASFGGIAYLVSVPNKAVLAIYAEENGQGMFFDSTNEDASSDGESSDENQADDVTSDKKKPHLKLVE